jgi:hypothetical protein
MVLKFKIRKRIRRILALGFFMLLIGLGNFYVGQIKTNEHQRNIEQTQQAILNISATPSGVHYSQLEFSLKKSTNRMNYYKLVSIGGLIFILFGLGLIFIGQLMRFN